MTTPDRTAPDHPKRRSRVLLERALKRSRTRLRGWRIDRFAGRGRAPIVYGNAVEVLPGGREVFGAVVDAIAAARESIAIEMYTWADDRIGRRLAEALAAKAVAGVRVLVLLDAFGSLGAGAVASDLEAAGARVIWYHALLPWVRRWAWNKRNHRKLVIVDGSVGFVGGVNIAESYSSEFAGEAAWRDLGVRVEGPAVRELVRLFVASWLEAGGGLEETGAVISQPAETGLAGVQVLGGRGLRARRRLRGLLIGQIAMARERILIANAYFAPERVLTSALCRAARRGVRVTLLLAGRTDARTVLWAGRAVYGELLGAGVEIREVHDVFLHAKAAIFDDDVLFTGSANLDYRSFRHNLEVAVGVFGRTAVNAALGALEPELAGARVVSADAWRRRPAADRVVEWAASAVRYWL